MVFGLGYLVNRMVAPGEAEAAQTELELVNLTTNAQASGAFVR
jgi:hypothetical protein